MKIPRHLREPRPPQSSDFSPEAANRKHVLRDICRENGEDAGEIAASDHFKEYGPISAEDPTPLSPVRSGGSGRVKQTTNINQ